MKYTIEGFSQAKAIELNLDLADLLVLRWFVDFSNTDKMVKHIIDNKIYFWIKYDGLLKELPILGITKDGLYRRLKKMVDKGVFEHTTFKNHRGIFSMYRLGKAYEILVADDEEGTESIPKGVRNEIREGTESITEQKNNLLNNKSTKNKDSVEQSSTIPYSEIIKYLNTKAETKYKSSSKESMKLIKARWKEGYRLEDFFSVIDVKVAEWKDSEKMAQYLRPQTLFTEKFESYLHQAQRSPKKKRYDSISKPASKEDFMVNDAGGKVVF